MENYHKETRLRDLIDAESYVWRKLNIGPMSDRGYMSREQNELLNKLNVYRAQITELKASLNGSAIDAQIASLNSASLAAANARTAATAAQVSAAAANTSARSATRVSGAWCAAKPDPLA